MASPRRANAPQDLELLRLATPCVDSDHPEVVEFAARHVGEARDPVQKSLRLYYAVRDGFRYDPYSAVLSVEGLRASTTLAVGKGWCVAKAVLLAACYRAQGLPARLGFADVRNHLASAQLREVMGTDVFYWHGYTSVHLAGRWVKATPAFNVELCERLGFLPLEFDGRNDSLFHPFDREGRRHMEYLHERGEYADPPIDEIRETFRERYPLSGTFANQQGPIGDFAAEVESEVAARRRRP